MEEALYHPTDGEMDRIGKTILCPHQPCMLICDKTTHLKLHERLWQLAADEHKRDNTSLMITLTSSTTKVAYSTKTAILSLTTVYCVPPKKKNWNAFIFSIVLASVDDFNNFFTVTIRNDQCVQQLCGQHAMFAVTVSAILQNFGNSFDKYSMPLNSLTITLIHNILWAQQNKCG